MRLYALGSNGSCQLGLGHDEDLSTPGVVDLPSGIQEIRSITCGGNHTLLLASSGEVYAAGSNAHRQCGPQSDTAMLFSAIDLAPFNGSVVLCAATWEASIFVTSDGQVIVTGAGSKGELGLGDGIGATTTPMAIPDFPPSGTSIVGLSSCMAHVVAILSDGTVFGWGAGRHGQLAEPYCQVWSPRRIPVPFEATGAVCGKDFTCVYNDDSDHPRLHMLGPGKRDVTDLKQSVQALQAPWKHVHASWSSLLCQSPSGRLVGFGQNQHGQLPPDAMPTVSKLAAGSEHIVAVTANDSVIAWGWGEHGNCGLPVDIVSPGWNELKVIGRPINVFAGCASTWIVVD